MPLRIIIAVFLAFLSHEGGHTITAKILTGQFLKFRFAWGRFHVPRFLWHMPDAGKRTQQAIAAAGFLTEAAMAFLLIFTQTSFWIIYAAVYLVHFFAYRFYAGKDSDFNWL